MPYCRVCGKELKEGDRFCSSCGTPVFSAEVTKGAEETVNYVRGTFQHRIRSPRYRLFNAIWGGVFLIGLGILWYFNFWWPGILFLIGIMILVRAVIAYVDKM